MPERLMHILPSRLVTRALAVCAAAALACTPVDIEIDDPPGTGWQRHIIASSLNGQTSVGLAADGAGNAFAVWGTRDGVFGARSPTDGPWDAPQRIGERQNGGHVDLAVHADGSALAVWRLDTELLAARFDRSRGWSMPMLVAAPASDFRVARDLVAWSTPSGVFVRGFRDGSWSEPERLAEPIPGGLLLDGFGVLGVAVNEADDAVVLWGHAAVGMQRDISRGLRASWRDRMGTWRPPEWVVEPLVAEIRVARLGMDARGEVLLAWQATTQAGDQAPAFMVGRREDGWTLEKQVLPELGLRLGQLARGVGGESLAVLLQAGMTGADRRRPFMGTYRSASGDWQPLVLLAGALEPLSQLPRISGLDVGVLSDTTVDSRGGGTAVWEDRGIYVSAFELSRGWNHRFGSIRRRARTVSVRCPRAPLSLMAAMRRLSWRGSTADNYGSRGPSPERRARWHRIRSRAVARQAAWRMPRRS